MRYGLYLADLRPSKNDSRGTINYAVGLASELPHVLRASEELFFLVNPEVWAEIAPLLAENVATVDVVSAPGGIVSRLALDHVGSVRWARRRRLDVVHFPKGHLPLWTPRPPATVATVHDDIAVRYARNEFGAGGRTIKSLYFARAVTHAVAAADRVLTVSAFSARQLAKLAPVRPGKLIVTHEAPALPAVPFVPLDKREPAILIMGSRFAHKRTAQTVRWACRFAESHPFDGWRVIVTGQLDSDGERACADQVVQRVRGVLSSLELAGLVARSRALVFGSAYEGFGLPPVEAYSLGTPATYQRIGAMAEVLDGFPGGYAQWRYEGFAEALSAVTALDDDILLALRATMRRRFRWREVARATLDAYRDAAAEPRRAVRRVGDTHPSGGRAIGIMERLRTRH